MQGLQQFVAFAETAKHGGFAAAARELGVAPSTLAKAVARLETDLGVKLFHRTTRQVQLTPDGERLFQRCQRVLVEVEDLQAEAADRALRLRELCASICRSTTASVSCCHCWQIWRGNFRRCAWTSG